MSWRILVESLPSSGLCVLGVGSELKADDAAGMLLIEKLREHCVDRDDLLLIAGSTAPENFTGQIKQFKPKHILIVDAARFDAEVGAISEIPLDQIKEASLSTHMLPLSFMIEYLHQELACQISLLGIALLTTEMGAAMSGQVAQAVDKLADALLTKLNQ